MQIDENNYFLEGDGGTGRKYAIDLKDGRIIRSCFIK
jgi:hypothetical protein